VYEQARADAPFHVQLWRGRIEPQPANATSIIVTGRIVRLFRNKGRALHWGQKVSFTIPIVNPEGSDTPVLDGTIRHAWESIGPARCLEAFLESWNGEINLVRSQVAAIRRPTWRPVCKPGAKGFLFEGNVRRRMQS
ncbi:MAG: hypothetical protein FWD08_06320, partial [Alphaproteobacteria bacterium]|nr:hypothetical protein [Alphaproteobacteria bacterium]